MSNQPIGIFDSGVGGTSIWKEIHQLMPYEDTVYLADSKNAPYGEKSNSEIVRLSIKNTEFLLSKKCKLIVVACNTATTNAIAYLRQQFKVPFIGIEPAIKPAALNSRSRTVGVLATKGTLGSQLFHHTSKNHTDGIRVMEQEGKGLVSLIEAGKEDNLETRNLLKQYLNPMLEANIDHLVLGCTHYPYLIPLLKELLPAHVKIIDCGEAVARQTHAVLKQHQLLCTNKHEGHHKFYSNTNPEILKKFLQEVQADKEITYQDF